MEKPNIYWIDLFCGGGGTTTGIHLVSENTKVLACVNHDQKAIESHKANHPSAIHFTEDIRDWKVIERLGNLVTNLRKKEPNCIVNLWASLECTNFSIAKGGPKNADSRSLAEHMQYYIKAIKPNYFYVENVAEFKKWGPLNKDDKPIKEKFGIFYDRWILFIQRMKYNYSSKILNSADFGSYQSRSRLFIIFSRKDQEVLWPEPTHIEQKKNQTNLFGLPSWKPVKEILELDNKGVSIFKRKKPLVENTLKRILAGLEKFVPQGQTEYSQTYNTGNEKNRVRSLNTAINTVTTANTHGLVFISNYKSGHDKSKNYTIHKPIGTITTIPTQSIVSLQTYYGKGGVYDITQPSPTVTTKDRIAKLDFEQLCYQEQNQFLYNPQYADKGRSIDRPCFTLIAKMDKRPPSIITVEKGHVKIYLEENDSETMIKIKEFMVKHQIVDIKMRMLLIPELKQIQGFPRDYVLKGNQAEQKKFIGNAVDVNVSTALAKANTYIIEQQYFQSTQKQA